MPTTAETARPYRHLTAAPNTGPTVPANAKLNTTTTAETGLRQTVLTAVSPIGAIVLPSAKPVMLTIAGTERRLSGLVRQTRPAPISPTAPPKFRAGPANPVISRREALVFLLVCPKKTKQVAAMEHIPAVMAVAETEPVAVPLR